MVFLNYLIQNTAVGDSSCCLTSTQIGGRGHLREYRGSQPHGRRNSHDPDKHVAPVVCPPSRMMELLKEWLESV